MSTWLGLPWSYAKDITKMMRNGLVAALLDDEECEQVHRSHPHCITNTSDMRRQRRDPLLPHPSQHSGKLRLYTLKRLSSEAEA
jgi:hypothetical protein